MHQKLLDLIPKRYLCPFCGEWHDWDGLELGYYDSQSYKAELRCDKHNIRKMHIYFSDGYCCYKTIPKCSRGNLDIHDRIPIEDIDESSKEPRVTFDVPFTANHDIGSWECVECDSKNICLICKLADENNSRHMNIAFGFEFEQSDYEKFSETALLARKERALKEQEDAVASKEQGSQRPQVKENKEDTTMANNLFKMNMEFGPNKDENIASTLMGVAVKNGESWRIYNKKKKEITDVGDMQLGNLPIFILPTTQLSEGDLIKDAGEYYFVTKVATPKTPTQTLSARTGEMKTIIPIKNVLGFSCYSKVIALSDSLNIGDDFDVEKLAIMSVMCSQSGENSGQMNQLLPLMFFKDKLGGDDDTMKMVLMSSMMASGEDGGQVNQLLPLMFLKNGDNGNDDTMKMVLISSIMGGNTGDSNNLLMSYLMLDTFMGKKEDMVPKKTDEGTVK